MNPHFFGDANEVGTCLALLIEIKESRMFANTDIRNNPWQNAMSLQHRSQHENSFLGWSERSRCFFYAH